MLFVAFLLLFSSFLLSGGTDVAPNELTASTSKEEEEKKKKNNKKKNDKKKKTNTKKKLEAGGKDEKKKDWKRLSQETGGENERDPNFYFPIILFRIRNFLEKAWEKEIRTSLFLFQDFLLFFFFTDLESIFLKKSMKI